MEKGTRLLKMLIFLNISFCNLIIKMYIHTQHFLIFEISKRRYQYCLSLLKIQKQPEISCWSYQSALCPTAGDLILSHCRLFKDHISKSLTREHISISCKQVMGKVEMDVSLLNKQIHLISETTFSFSVQLTMLLKMLEMRYWKVVFYERGLGPHWGLRKSYLILEFWEEK